MGFTHCSRPAHNPTQNFLSVNSKICFNCDDCLASCSPLFTVFVLS